MENPIQRSVHRWSPYEQCEINPSIIPWNTGWFIGDSPFLDYYHPQYIKGSTIPELIINQQGFSSHCSYAPAEASHSACADDVPEISLDMDFRSQYLNISTNNKQKIQETNSKNTAKSSIINRKINRNPWDFMTQKNPLRSLTQRAVHWPRGPAAPQARDGCHRCVYTYIDMHRHT